jgi:hypothetical protein
LVSFKENDVKRDSFFNITDYSLDPTDTIDRCVDLVIDKKAWTTATLDSLFPSCGATKNCDYLSHDENAPEEMQQYHRKGSETISYRYIDKVTHCTRKPSPLVYCFGRKRLKKKRKEKKRKDNS